MLGSVAEVLEDLIHQLRKSSRKIDPTSHNDINPQLFLYFLKAPTFETSQVKFFAASFKYHFFLKKNITKQLT